MNKNQVDFVTTIVKINANKVEKSLCDEMKQMYRTSIKMGKRREFINQVKVHIDVMGEKSITEICAELGERMFAFAEILGQYSEFIKWLERMTGQTLFKGDMK